MANRNNQSAKQFCRTAESSEIVLIKAENRYHVPESFKTCTVEVQGGGPSITEACGYRSDSSAGTHIVRQ